MDEPLVTVNGTQSTTTPVDVKAKLLTHIVTPDGTPAMTTQDLAVWYGADQALAPTNITFPEHQITALIGASGSGKSTFLRCLNRMNDGIATVQGQILYHKVNVNAANTNVYRLRRDVGMVFQSPQPFGRSIYDNITLGLREHGIRNRQELDAEVERSLRAAALWDEVKDDLKRSALSLSGGQQQRLCIARALALRPEVLLLDEPASALDPISTVQIESTLRTLRADYTIIIVTHNMEQARRLSDYTAFFHQGRVREFAPTAQLFMTPELDVTSDYVTGKFG